MHETILVVDDDREIVGAIAIPAGERGLSGNQGLQRYGGPGPVMDPAVQLLLIGVMMPRLDGLSAVMRIRDRRNLPIIVLSARSEETDKILGLSVGADDYVTKPFSPQELAARVRSQLRRYTPTGDVHGRPGRTRSSTGGSSTAQGIWCWPPTESPVRLTATETRIVDLLMRNLGRIFSGRGVYRRVWEGEGYAPENTRDGPIRRIREKIELNPRQPEYLKVVWGIGYRWKKDLICWPWYWGWTFAGGARRRGVCRGRCFFPAATAPRDAFQPTIRNTALCREIEDRWSRRSGWPGAPTRAVGTPWKRGGSNLLCPARDTLRLRRLADVCSNTETALAVGPPVGYNSAPTCDGGRVSIHKDGEALDIYGDGVYAGQPLGRAGLQQPSGGRGDGDIRVYLAAIAQPVRVRGCYSSLYELQQGRP